MTQFKEITLDMTLGEIADVVRPALRLNHLWQLKSGLWGAQFRSVGDGRFFKFGWGPGPEIALTEALRHGMAGINDSFKKDRAKHEVGPPGAWPEEYVADSDRVEFGVPYDRCPGDVTELTDPIYADPVAPDLDDDDLLGGGPAPTPASDIDDLLA